jgi:hypothetical protein
MKRVVLAVLVAVFALQAPAWAGDSATGAAAQQKAGSKYHLAVSGMT